MEQIVIEVDDPVKALEQLLDITLYLRHYIGKAETDPSEENNKRRRYWETRRDNWINKHKAK